ncbi:unnamed protein product, partial [Effrenium voratum]
HLHMSVARPQLSHAARRFERGRKPGGFWDHKSVELGKGYNQLIKAQGLKSAWEGALSLASDQLLRGSFDLSTAQQLLGACGKARRWQLALEVFRQLPRWQVSPDAVCHNMVAAGLLKAGLWEKALSTVQEAFGGPFPATVVTYNTGIAACERGSAWRHALQLLQE